MSAGRDPGPRGFWERAIGLFMDNGLVVGVVLALLVLAGLATSPFDWELGPIPRDRIPVDAIPDVGENQQIVFTRWAGRSPRDVEDQVTYPLTTALLGIPGVRTVRSSSMMGFSVIYVIFEDGTEFYWSRSRVLEKLSSLPAGTLPDDVAPALGPDATALGQVYWYTLEGQDADGNAVGGWDLHELRSVQDWSVRYALAGVPGVSEVASVGGHVREYQVDVDPEALKAHDVTLEDVARAVSGSNLDVGARTIELNRAEYVLRGLGFVRSTDDLAQTVVAVRNHTPVRVNDVARIGFGPAERRGVLDDEGAEAVGGVVVVRYGENPMEVIQRVKERIEEIQGGLPSRTLDDGTVSQVTIVPFYDRTTLIDETLGTLSIALLQQILITIIVVLVMLRNLRSSLMISSLLPLGVLLAFVLMWAFGVDANIMALSGIAIAIGTMVDMGIVFTENIEARLAKKGAESRTVAIRRAAAEVAPAILTSGLTTIVSFLPVFALTASEGKLFRPLAFTKSFALLAALLLSIMVLPVAAKLFFRDRAPSPPGEGFDRLRESVWRNVHVGDWALLSIGLVLVFFLPWAGALLLWLGVSRLLVPVLPKRLSRVPERVELAAAFLFVWVYLSVDWLPLGPEAGLLASLLFVGLSIGLVLGGFAVFMRVYQPLLRGFLRHKVAFLIVPVIITVGGVMVWRGSDSVLSWLPESIRTSRPALALASTFPGLGREYMPPFDEGSYLYMPSTMPHASLGEATQLLSDMDARIAAVPEVDRVVGKLGRVDSALDPAPISMFETVVTYVPEYSIDDEGNRIRNWRDHIRTPDDIWDEIVMAGQGPGLTSAPLLQPISTRIVMLQSGMRAPLGIKIHGPDLESIERFGLDVERALQTQRDVVRPETVFADRVVGKPYLEIAIDREAIARYGLSIERVQRVIQIALGGMTLTRSVEGRERYPIRVRYLREERDSVEAIRRVLVSAPGGEQIPLEQLADIRYARGPQVIKSEDTFLTSYVLFDRQPDIAEVDAVERIDAFLKERIDSGDLVRPEGVSYSFAGTYENQLRSEQRLSFLVPIAVSVVFLLLYMQFRRTSTALAIFAGIVVAVAGAFLLIWLYAEPWFMDFSFFGRDMRDLFQVNPVNLSVAVWVGVIALVGIATDNGVVMATYLRQRFDDEPPQSVADVHERTVEAAMRRLRPCLMTTATTLLALLPVITSQGRGADVMVPLAIPVLGGMSVALVTVFVVPVLYCWVEEGRLEERRVEESKPAE